MVIIGTLVRRGCARGDIRRICDLFGLPVGAAERNMATIDHPGLAANATPGRAGT